MGKKSKGKRGNNRMTEFNWSKVDVFIKSTTEAIELLSKDQLLSVGKGTDEKLSRPDSYPTDEEIKALFPPSLSVKLSLSSPPPLKSVGFDPDSVINPVVRVATRPLALGKLHAYHPLPVFSGNNFKPYKPAKFSSFAAVAKHYNLPEKVMALEARQVEELARKRRLKMLQKEH